MTGYRIRGLDPATFTPFYGMADADLAGLCVVRMPVTETPGSPCRVTLADAEPGETVLLLNYEHLPADTPYRSRHAIFVREGADTAADAIDCVPDVLAIRLLSVRAFDAADMMIAADVIDGTMLDTTIRTLFADPAVAHIDVHNAKRGCFAARVMRHDS